MNYLRLLLSVIFSVVALAVQGQSTRLKAANKQFENLAYAHAAQAYEDFLRVDKRKDPAETQEAYTKLAYSYRALQDTKNAERIYADLIKEFPETDAKNYLYYAQALAANGKYRDSQKMYSKYGERQKEDLRGRKFTVSYMDMSRFFQDSSAYRVDYLPINSPQADFSPMYYQNGLAFVSARNESGPVKRIFGWNQTPFLDLYLFPDTTELRTTPNPGVQAASLGGGDVITESTEVMPGNDRPLSKTEVFSRTLNTKYHEGPMTFFKDQSRIIFTRNNTAKGKNGKSADGIRKLKLYIAQNNGGSWQNIEELPFCSNDYSVGHPALSADDTKLFFVSDMPGGYGGTDLYVVEYKDGQWSSPVNMGKEINTEGNEMFPFVDENNNLYFSSDGHEGLGGLDLFYAELRDGVAFKGVQNLGYPLNSEKDDFGLITSQNRSTGYFSSNRKRGVSDDNIYSFRRTCKQLNIFVYDAKTNEPIAVADVRVIKAGVNQDLRFTGTDGKTGFCVDANVDYEFKAIKEGYATNSVRFSTMTQSERPVLNVSIYLEKSENTLVKGTVKTEVNQQPAPGVTVTLRNDKDKSEQRVVTGSDGKYEFEMKPGAPYTLTTEKNRYTANREKLPKMKAGKNPKLIEKQQGIYGEGDVFELKNIYYDYNKFFIRPDAARELDHLVALLRKYPEMKIELRSHTDSRASDAYNLQLSTYRARAAVDYLVNRGIEPNRLSAQGYGESEILNGCTDQIACPESKHQQNRRTEFKIVTVQRSNPEITGK
ncbi:outer membrane protein OmpA-like peptidoglycan-associated protein [Larkinella arboricola]|uniref:Outer membrane protein OmpA-like peptidoglycan-associated protein n=1 Tax=Larkinella arboricola TaxID=643671 RepID=A0A327X042_LARAB|nr:OmpA family protein [Larkinella arboricola]RAJ99820.1 outer membrane protein OmpA-like peptidoglycan-associated protein [Larkinella arboricola]